MFFKSKPVNLPAPEVLTQQIMYRLNVNQNDLSMNRQGRLSPMQVQSFEGLIKKGGKSTLIIVPLIVMISLGIMGAQFAGSEGSGMRQTFEENPLILIGGIGGSLLLYVLVAAFSLFRARNFKVENLKVKSADGKVKITKTQIVGMMWAVMKAGGAQGYSYEIKVGRQKVYAFDPSVEEVFMKDAKYRIYYTKMQNVPFFVAAEAVAENG